MKGKLKGKGTDEIPFMSLDMMIRFLFIYLFIYLFICLYFYRLHMPWQGNNWTPRIIASTSSISSPY